MTPYILHHFAHLAVVWIHTLLPSLVFSQQGRVQFDCRIHDGSPSPDSGTLGEIITPIYMHLLLARKVFINRSPKENQNLYVNHMATILSSNIHS